MADIKNKWVLTGEGIEPSDYANPSNWLSLASNPDKEVDVFFTYATGYLPENPDDAEVCTIDNKRMRSRGDYQIAAKASVFAPLANIYAPYYRQLDARLPLGMSDEESRPYFTVPKMDVFAALDYYFEHYNGGRPFILAGHSQGSVMVCFILEEYLKDRPELLERMVAAYPVGFSITKKWLTDNPHVSFASGEDDTGVVISWNVEGPENKNYANVVVREGAISINPLNWRLDEEYAPVELNLGALFAKDGPMRREEGFADAQLDLQRGVVVCRSADPQRWAVPQVDMFGPQSYHSWDYGFYYENMRQNAALRIEKFLEKYRK